MNRNAYGMTGRMIPTIAAGFGLVLALAVALGLSAISSMKDLSGISGNLYEHPFKVSIAVQEMKSSVFEIRERMLYMMLAGNDVKKAGMIDEISRLDRQVEQNLSILKKGFLGDMDRILEAERLIDEWRRERNDAIDLENKGRHDEARRMVEQRGAAIFEPLVMDLEYVARFAKNRAQSYADQARSEEFATIRRIVRYLIGLVVISGITAWYVLSRISEMIGRSERMSGELLESRIRAQSAQYTRSLIEASLDPLVTISPEGKIMDVNEATVEVTGMARRELVGSDFSDYFTEPEMARAGYLRVFEKGSVRDYPLTIKHRDGHLVDVLYNASVYRDESGAVRGIFAAARDITERNRAVNELKLHRDHLEELVKGRTMELESANERLEELDRLKSMFIASMSHELRTPLNSIIGFTGIILQGMTGEISGEQKKQLSIVKESAAHLLQLVNDVIDISKIEAGKAELHIEKFDLSQLVREVVNSFSVETERKGLKLEADLPDNLVIESDKRRVRQILFNILGNAVKFTEEGKISVRMETRGKGVEVEVKDTGVGIREEDMGKLFTAFAQIVKGDVPKEGSGLGLYLSRKIAELLGGSISARSEFGKGSVFTFFVKEGK